MKIYSVDTSAFYTDNEKRIQDLMNRGHLKKNQLIKERTKLDKKNEGYLDAYDAITMKIKHHNNRNKQLKNRIKHEFTLNDKTRVLRNAYITDNNVISVFDSVLTRALKIDTNTISTDILIVQAYFFDILQELIKEGFFLNDEKYICFTASAGQIRTKKTVFIRESVFNEYHDTLMCGLSIGKINKHGGINVNKYLAYLALCNSATEEWVDFDIDKTIVVDDFCSLVDSEVDFIDDVTYTVERKKMSFPIEHTDGCGMILPKKSRKPLQVRGPWIKGLLEPFPFDKFIREHNRDVGYAKYGIVHDIYGTPHDILKEGIEVILTKSQFKMWKFYSSWKEYQTYFKEYNCKAGKCNEEEERIKNAKINYQMLQTLTDITKEELLELCIPSINMIQSVGTDKKTMLEILGVTDYNVNKNYFQQALELYPELLKDTYSREVLKETRKKLINNAKAGKLKIEGKYTFISPDLYAFCEKLILKLESPKGLLQNGEVFCSLYTDGETLDCLRSPHLYREHAIRQNRVDKEMKRWFVTKSLYTSCHDPISKILQFDCDGDKALVCRDETLVRVAKRNMEGIVPLYYEMKKADPEIVTIDSIYEGLKSAYTGGNIGTISNNISKVWNSKDINLDIIKKLCMENNFTID
ncbi:RNA dependent RNA polymerase [Paenibacillus sp. FSL H3-0333]|uniref:RNA dependent RNA polymerase n=1 Tax=Paenibacillus sp. FSL H3-0333 TaxID=2921373 RepID=UPI0030FCE76A